MDEIMSVPEFRRGMLRLADNRMEACIARRLVAAYINADDDAKADCSRMLREDLDQLRREYGRPTGPRRASCSSCRGERHSMNATVRCPRHRRFEYHEHIAGSTGTSRTSRWMERQCLDCGWWQIRKLGRWLPIATKNESREGNGNG